MRSIFMMRTIVLLFLFGVATSTMLPGATTTSVSRKWPVVFGFEFTMSGIVTSAGLPNGTVVPIINIPGNAAYRKKMAELYSVCQETARTGILPAVAQEYRSAGAPFRWRSMEPHRWVGGSVAELTEAVIIARRAALEMLAEKHGVTDLKTRDTFHALATAPSFIFNAIKSSSARCPHDDCELRSLEFESDQEIDALFLARAWQSVMAAQFSQAVVEAGFHRCTIPHTESLEYLRALYPQPYDDLEFVHPAASHAICAAEVGVCRLKTLGIGKRFWEKGLEPCSKPESVVVVVDLQATGLSLWAEGVNRCYLKPMPWNTWPELRPPRMHGAFAWSSKVERKIYQLLKDTVSDASARHGITLIPTGNGWSPDLLWIFRKVTSFETHGISQPEFAASINAVKIARWEERSLSMEWDFRQDSTPETDVTFFDRDAFGVFQDGTLRPSRCNLPHEYWCEQPCKWTVPPMFYGSERYCVCPKIGQTFPRMRRDELRRIEWEAGQAVIQRLSRKCKALSWHVCEYADKLPYVARS